MINNLAVRVYLMVFSLSALGMAIQPSLGKLLLPTLGGSPLVWALVTVFFQILLVLGYAFARKMTEQETQKGFQSIASLYLGVGGLIIVTSLYTLVWWMNVIFVALLGITLFTSTFTWSSWMKSQKASEEQQISLYAVSNAGSFFGLGLSVSLFEPFLSIVHQWLVVGGLLVIIGILSFIQVRTYSKPEYDEGELKTVPFSLSIFTAAFLGSWLLVVTTWMLMSDTIAAPLLWVIPFALYLTASVHVFRRAKTERTTQVITVILFAFSFFFLFILSMKARITMPWFQLFASSIGIEPKTAIALIKFLKWFWFLFGMTAFQWSLQELIHARRPIARTPMLFYWTTIGGVGGGLVAGLVMPWMLSQRLEFTVLMVATTSCIVWHLIDKHSESLSTFQKSGRILSAAIFMGLMCFWLGLPQDERIQRYEHRGWFGEFRVEDVDDVRLLTHGSTIHGIQYLDESKKTQPLSYYATTTSLGKAIEWAVKPSSSIAIIGMGTGAMFCTIQEPATSIDMIEIDPAMVGLSEDDQPWFTYKNLCAPNARILVGDGRVVLRQQEKRYDVIVLDAFHSDAIPQHLLTKEAFAEYKNQLTDNGIIIAHISHRWLALDPELARIGSEIGLTTYGWFSTAPNQKHVDATITIVMTNNPTTIPPHSFHKLISDGKSAWTDQKSSMIRAFFQPRMEKREE